MPLFIFFGLGIALAISLTKDPRKLPSQLIDRPFPEFRLPDLNAPDKMIGNEVLHGRVSLVNVFGSWCVACDAEHPMLVRMARNEGVFIIGVDWRDTVVKANRWLAERGNPYAQIVFDADSKLAIDLGVTGAPESFLVDKKGQIRYKVVGPISIDIWENTLKPLIATLEAET
ncbi:MAG TPA: DsbE family thiol:disulfide interchange protein [Hellea balneolensis]|uniref:DsbE family thiol:disulfide interchange protein n=1 Tax=Hellea balneolensis TaxID=287478 RepID=A0A7C3C408_9PROT|nr:DsbE family thiol:disulfide interchange protein [Hellea balneolensis]